LALAQFCQLDSPQWPLSHQVAYVVSTVRGARGIEPGMPPQAPQATLPLLLLLTLERTSCTQQKNLPVCLFGGLLWSRLLWC